MGLNFEQGHLTWLKEQYTIGLFTFNLRNWKCYENAKKFF